MAFANPRKIRKIKASELNEQAGSIGSGLSRAIKAPLPVDPTDAYVRAKKAASLARKSLNLCPKYSKTF